MMIKTIIFDFYGVFQIDPYMQWLETNKLSLTGEYLAALHSLDRGEIDREKFISRLSDELGRPIDYSEIYSAQTLNQEILELVVSLGRQYKIGLLSNASRHLRDKLDDNGLSRHFDEIIISSEAGIAKPDPQIFALALAKLNAHHDEVLFIDDNTRYVDAAERLSIKSILFTSVEKLKKDLLDLGVKKVN